MKLYFWPTPNGKKISIALEEMDIPYQIKYIDLTKGEQLTPDFLTISPNSKIPALVDPNVPDGRPISIFESGAILQYLVRKTGRFYPQEERMQVEMEQWLFWQVASLGPMAGQAFHFLHLAKEKVPYGIDRYTKEVKRLFGVLDARLKGREYIAREYSVVDMACYPWVVAYQKLGIDDIEEFPELKTWMYRVGERPAVKKGMNVGEETR